MLMIRKDMGMKSLSPLIMRSDVLSEKIIGNYRLMQYSVTAQDLLHMAMVKPELYVGMENISTVCIEQINVPNNTVKLEMINQFLNRILCMNAPQFTYQDEVYITTVLNKLGIQDVKEFVKQINAIRLQNELTVRLSGQYEKKEKDLKNILEAVFSHEKQGEYDRKEESTQNHGLYLQNEIIKRLETAKISNALYAIQQSYIRYHAINQETAVLTEQIHFGDELYLSQIRQEIFRQDSPVLWQQYNHYEHAKLAMEEMTEQNIFSQISAAILTNLIQQLSYEKIRHEESKNENWRDYSRVIYRSAEGVLQRIQNYESKDYALDSLMLVNIDNMNRLNIDETNLLEIMNGLFLSDKTEYTQIQKNMVLTLLENQNLKQQITESVRVAAISIRSYGTYTDLLQEQEFLKTLQLQQVQMAEYREDVTNLSDFAESIQSTVKRYDITEQIQTVSIENRKTDAVNQTSYDMQAEMTLQPYLKESRIVEQIFEAATPMEREKLYFEYLTQVNEHNVQMNRKILQNPPKEQKVSRIVIDREQAIKNMRKALENPQEVINEIYKTGQSIQPVVPASIQYLLELADEPTRILYEQVLGITIEKRETEEKIRFVETESKELQEILQAVEAEAGQLRERAAAAETITAITENYSRKIENVIENAAGSSVTNAFSYTAGFDLFHMQNYITLQNDGEIAVQNLQQVLQEIETNETLIRENKKKQIEKLQQDILQQAVVRQTIQNHTIGAAAVVYDKKSPEAAVMQKMNAPAGWAEEQQKQNTMLYQEIMQQAIMQQADIETGAEDAAAAAAADAGAVSAAGMVREKEISAAERVLSKEYINMRPEGEGNISLEPAAEQIIEKIIPKLAAGESAGRQEMLPAREEKHPSVSLVHVRTEQLEEAFLDEIRNMVQIKESAEEREYQTINSKITDFDIQTQIQETKQEILEENKKVISSLIQENLMSQMRNISNRVYQDIERKLSGERKRRGY